MRTIMCKKASQAIFIVFAALSELWKADIHQVLTQLDCQGILSYSLMFKSQFCRFNTHQYPDLYAVDHTMNEVEDQDSDVLTLIHLHIARALTQASAAMHTPQLPSFRFLACATAAIDNLSPTLV